MPIWAHIRQSRLVNNVLLIGAFFIVEEDIHSKLVAAAFLKQIAEISRVTIYQSCQIEPSWLTWDHNNGSNVCVKRHDKLSFIKQLSKIKLSGQDK